MTIQQYQEAKAAIEKRQCLIATKYIIDPDAPECQMCVLGALALYAGVSKQTLVDASSDFISAWNDGTLIISKAITDRFGLTLEQQRTLQALNDECDDGEARKSQVLATLREML